MTIDLDIQLAIERELDNVMTKYNPEQSLILVADPNTGEILAMSGKQIIVRNTHDPKLLGGMKLRYSGIQLDGSIRTRLDSFEKSIGALVI